LQITKSILNHDLKYFDFKSSPSLTAAKKRTKKKQIPIICKDHTHVGGLAQWLAHWLQSTKLINVGPD